MENSYTKNDYSVINKAIHQESIKQENLNQLTKTVRTTYLIASAAGVLLILLLIIAIYKLLVFHFNPDIIEKPVIVEKPTVVMPEIDYVKLGETLAEYAIDFKPIEGQSLIAPENNKSVEDALLIEQQLTRSIDSQTIEKDLPADEKQFIETSFTVFHSSITPSGESVMTGKEYSPDNLLTPSHQYCYLERAENKNTYKASITHLANYDGDKVNHYSDDEYYKSLVAEYCLFR